MEISFKLPATAIPTGQGVEQWMKDFFHLLSQYGAWPILAFLLVYVVKNGRFTFQYPRPEKEDQRRSEKD